MKSVSLQRIILLTLFCLIADSAIGGALFNHYSFKGKAYYSGGVQLVNYKDAQVSASPIVATARVGKYFRRNFAYEAQLLIGVVPGTYNMGGAGDIEIKPAYGVSVFLKPDLEFNDWLAAYAMLGYSMISFENKVFGTTVSKDDSGVSYGAGMEMRFANDSKTSLEYIQYLDLGTRTYSAINLTYTKEF